MNFNDQRAGHLNLIRHLFDQIPNKLAAYKEKFEASRETRQENYSESNAWLSLQAGLAERLQREIQSNAMKLKFKTPTAAVQA